MLCLDRCTYWGRSQWWQFGQLSICSMVLPRISTSALCHQGQTDTLPSIGHPFIHSSELMKHKFLCFWGYFTRDPDFQLMINKKLTQTGCWWILEPLCTRVSWNQASWETTTMRIWVTLASPVIWGWCTHGFPQTLSPVGIVLSQWESWATMERSILCVGMWTGKKSKTPHGYFYSTDLHAINQSKLNSLFLFFPSCKQFMCSRRVLCVSETL